MEREFVKFAKISRLSRNVIVTEKIDGTNSCIYIGEDGEFLTGSRNRWITPQDDNFGFSRWAHDHKPHLLSLGQGLHHGEWWGNGIQRGYGLPKGEKRFSLFNTTLWYEEEPFLPFEEKQLKCPPCCCVIPILYYGIFNTQEIDRSLHDLSMYGSKASPGFNKPEGVVIYHIAGNVMFKKTIEKDDERKGK